jgi:hypothetical protein
VFAFACGASPCRRRFLAYCRVMAELPGGIDTTVPRGPRVYDYWLGGTNNYPADRAVAEQVLRFMPEILDSVRGNRKFLQRAVAFVRDAGVRQFLDMGCGLPNSPNVHEIAQVGGTRGRVAYVDLPRDKDAIARMFNGLPLVDPGLVLVSRWRPEGGSPGPGADRAWTYGGVAIL